MQAPLSNPFLEVTQEQMQNVRKHFNIDEVKLRKDLDVIQEWIKKEEHLAKAVEYLDSSYMERIYIIEKGSVERTKLRIDRLLTTRGMVAEITRNKTIDEFEDLSKHITYLPLPKLSPTDLTRVTVIKVSSEKANNVMLLDYFRYAFLVIDYCMKFEYNLGETYILDLEHFNTTGLSKLNPFIFKKATVLCMEGYGLKIKGCHIVNAPSFVDKILMIIKNAVKEKISRRVEVHNTFEDLQKKIPKEVLPKEYGGDLESCSILYDEFKKTLRSQEGRQIIENTNKLVTDESKRSSYSFNAEYLGMPGSFSQLIVD